MKPTVAIVDDSSDLRSLLEVLIMQYCDVRVAGYGSYSDVVADKDTVLDANLIILDVNLGTGLPSGLDVYHWLKANNHRGNLFFLTGHANSHPEVKLAFESGVAVLEKPFSPNELIDYIRPLVSGGPTVKINPL